jgi:hypothetical protein
MTASDWFSLLHPLLMILFVYPVVGATVRLGILVRERRLAINPLPATVPVEHADHGRWLTTGVVVAVLVALTWSMVCRGAEVSMAAAAPRSPWLGSGGPRLTGLLGLGAAALAGCLALWRVRRRRWRAGSALLCWLALLVLGLQPGVRRLSDDVLSADFWRSHFWSGWLLSGLLLFCMAARPEISQSFRMRRLHVAAVCLIAVLLAVQAITGSRDLLQMVSAAQKVA